MRSIEEIRKELREAEEAEAERCRAKANAVKPDYTFILTPTSDTWAPIFDDSYKLYLLTGIVNNKEELKAVGKRAFDGSMRYVFNTLSGNFVMAVSGGAVFTRDPKCFESLSRFITNNPEGGDVTSIVNSYRKDY